LHLEVDLAARIHHPGLFDEGPQELGKGPVLIALQTQVVDGIAKPFSGAPDRQADEI
jgi:hypothetical protein